MVGRTACPASLKALGLLPCSNFFFLFLLLYVQLEETEYELREIEQFRQLARVTS